MRTKSDYGMAIVMNVKTGEVLAMANAPTFDSAEPERLATEARGNNAISSPYEPGSVREGPHLRRAHRLGDGDAGHPDHGPVPPAGPGR